MERLQVGLLAWDPVLHELEKRYSTKLDARLRFKGVWCPSRRDDLVQAVWYRLWRRCSKPEGWKPGKGKDPLWTLIKKIADNLRLDLNRRRRTHEKHWAGYCEAFSQFDGDAAASVPAKTRQPGERAPRGPRVQLVGGMTRRERASLEREALLAFQELPAKKQKILLLVADGHTTRQIGEKIDRSPGRVSIDLNDVRREVIE
jgi:RNA polymerase sigma factor (sigma-70 family)